MEPFPSSHTSWPRPEEEEGGFLSLWMRTWRMLPWLLGAGVCSWLGYRWFLPLPVTYVALATLILIFLFGFLASRWPWNAINLLGIAVGMGSLWRAEMFVVAQTFRWAVVFSLGTLGVAVLGRRWLLTKPWRWLLALAGVGYLALWAWSWLRPLSPAANGAWWEMALGGGMVAFWGMLMATTWTEWLYQPEEDPLTLAGNLFIEFWALIWTLPLLLKIPY